jgi:hypothetical protein
VSGSAGGAASPPPPLGIDGSSDSDNGSEVADAGVLVADDPLRASAVPLAAPPVIACDLSCPAGPCAKRAGASPSVVAGPSIDHIAALAVGSNDVFLGTISRAPGRSGQLRRVSPAAGASALVVDDQQVSWIGIAPDETLYFVTDAPNFAPAQKVWSVAGAAAPSVVMSSDTAIVEVVPISKGFFYEIGAGRLGIIGPQITEADGTVGGGTGVQFLDTPHGLAFDGATIYWASGDGPSSIQSVSNDGQFHSFVPGTLLTAGDDVLAKPTIDGADLYFVHQHAPGDCQGSIAVMPAAGGTPSLVSLGHTGSDVRSFAFDASYVYWTTPDAGGVVFRAAKGGGTPEIVADGQANAAAVAVDDARIYWVAAGTFGDEVRAVTK